MPQAVLFGVFCCWLSYKLCIPQMHLYTSILQTNNEDESKCRYFVVPLENKPEVKSRGSAWLLEVQHSQGLNVSHVP